MPFLKPLFALLLPNVLLLLAFHSGLGVHGFCAHYQCTEENNCVRLRPVGSCFDENCKLLQPCDTLEGSYESRNEQVLAALFFITN